MHTRRRSISALLGKAFGNLPTAGGHLLLSRDEVDGLTLTSEQPDRFIRPFYGLAKFMHLHHEMKQQAAINGWNADRQLFPTYCLPCSRRAFG